MGVHTLLVLGIFLSVAALSIDDLMKAIPFFAPLVASSFFAFYYGIQDLLALTVAFYFAYKYNARLGIAAILIYLAVHIPHIVVLFRENAVEFLRFSFSGFIAILGIWLIHRLRKSEESVKQSRERLQLQIERMPIALIVWDTEFRVQTWNPSAERIFGFTVEEAVGKHPYDIVVPKEARPHVDAVWTQLLAGDMTAHSVNENITGDGRTIVCDWTNTPLKENDGSVAGVLSMVQDITERKLAEERVAHITAVLRSIRNVNQLITHEKDRERLIQKGCDMLVEGRSYEKSWILLLDDNRNPVSVASSGFSRESSVFLENLKTGNYSECVKELLPQEKPFLAYDQPGLRHKNCVLADIHSTRGVFRCRLESEGKLYGVLGVTISSASVSDEEEQDLFLELCGDIAFALASIANEKERREVETRYQTLLRTALDGFWVVDNRGHFLDVNDSYCRLTGYSRDELLKMGISDIEASENSEETATHIDKIMKVVGDRFATKHRRRDGAIVDVEVSVNYLSEAGLLYCFLRDITERKQAENAIALLLDKESQAAKEWQETFDAISDIVFLLSPSHEIRRINKAGCEATGKKLEDLIGKKCYHVIHGLGNPIGQCPGVQALKTKEVCTSESNEGGRYYLLTAYPIFDKDGEIISLTHIVKDISKVKQIQEQLIMQDRLVSIGQLVSGVAHELNNPLTSVIGFSELVLQKDLPDDIKADLKIVNDEAKRTSLIVKNLLSFARQQPQDKKAIDINEPLKTVLQLRRHEQSSNNITVDIHLALDLPQVMGNNSQLQQVFFNVVTNAEQAMLAAHKKGTLTITTEKTGDNIRVRFTNDGPEISPENMKKIFTPFFTTKETGKGTGLGLSICHGIITEHGGKIWAESKPGEGATFIVELPTINNKGARE